MIISDRILPANHTSSCSHRPHKHELIFPRPLKCRRYLPPCLISECLETPFWIPELLTESYSHIFDNLKLLALCRVCLQNLQHFVFPLDLATAAYETKTFVCANLLSFMHVCFYDICCFWCNHPFLKSHIQCPQGLC